MYHCISKVGDILKKESAQLFPPLLPMISPSKTNGITMPAIAPSNVVLAKLWEEAVNEYIIQTDLSEQDKVLLRVCDTPEAAIFDVTKYNWQRNLTRKQLRNSQVAQKTI